MSLPGWERQPRPTTLQAALPLLQGRALSMMLYGWLCAWVHVSVCTCVCARVWLERTDPIREVSVDSDAAKHPWTEISTEEKALNATAGGPITSYLHDLGQIVDVLRTRVSLSGNQMMTPAHMGLYRQLRRFLSCMRHPAKGDSGSALCQFYIWSL